jgi:hypothetical protein
VKGEKMQPAHDAKLEYLEEENKRLQEINSRLQLSVEECRELIQES